MSLLTERLLNAQYHSHEEVCCCGEECCCHDHEEKEIEQQLSEEEIEKIIEERYSEKDEKTKGFIRKSIKIHGTKYDYSETTFVRSKDKVTIICPVEGHGSFSIFSSDHLRTNKICGCPICGRLRVIEKRRDTKEEFIRKSKEKYPNQLDYSKVNYVNSRTRVILICKKHNIEFEILPSAHLSNRFGCPECSREKKSRLYNKNESNPRWTFKWFVDESIKKYGNKFDYSKAEKEFVNSNTPVTIICPIHGEFKMSPRVHLKLTKTGCPTCGHDLMVKNKSFSTESFIKLAEERFPNKFDYSKVIYTKAKDKVLLRCIHDLEFWITPDHLFNDRHGCPECAKEATGQFRKYSIAELQEHFDCIYGEKVFIILPNQEYKDRKTDITVFDIRWNEYFTTKPAYLLNGTGNPNHRDTMPKGERLVSEWCNKNNIIVDPTRKLTGTGISGRNNNGYVFVDFKITYKDTPIIIEYNGIQHYKYIPFFHDTLEDFRKQLRRDKEVRDYCERNQIKFIEIPYTIIDTGVSDFLTKTIIENIDPYTLVDYDSLYKIDDNST